MKKIICLLCLCTLFSFSVSCSDTGGIDLSLPEGGSHSSDSGSSVSSDASTVEMTVNFADFDQRFNQLINAKGMGEIDRINTADEMFRELESETETHYNKLMVYFDINGKAALHAYRESKKDIGEAQAQLYEKIVRERLGPEIDKLELAKFKYMSMKQTLSDIILIYDFLNRFNYQTLDNMDAVWPARLTTNQAGLDKQVKDMGPDQTTVGISNRIHELAVQWDNEAESCCNKLLAQARTDYLFHIDTSLLERYRGLKRAADEKQTDLYEEAIRCRFGAGTMGGIVMSEFGYRQSRQNALEYIYICQYLDLK